MVIYNPVAVYLKFQNKIWAYDETLFKRRHSHFATVLHFQQVDEGVGPLDINMEEEGQVNHHSQGEQQELHREADLDEHDDSQHGQQAAVQVVLQVFTQTGGRGGWGDKRVENRLRLSMSNFGHNHLLDVRTIFMPTVILWKMCKNF